MNNKLKNLVLIVMLLIANNFLLAQVKIGDNPTTINSGSVLELESTNKGLLFTRVSLTNTTVWGLAGTPVNGMQVYNTNASITQGSTAYPIIKGGKGMYYWDSIGWVTMKFEAGSTFQYGAGTPTGACSGDVIYVDTSETSPTEGQTWTCSGGSWITYTPKNGTEWMFGNTTNDAGGSKSARIWRNGYVGIASPNVTSFNPSVGLHILNDAYPNTSVDNVTIESYGGAGQSWPGIVTWFNLGTKASFSPVNDNMQLGLYGGGTQTSNGKKTNGYMGIFADGNHTDMSTPTKLYFATTPSGSTTFRTRMTIKENGYVGIGTSTPTSGLTIFGENGTNLLDPAAGNDLRIVGYEGTGGGYFPSVIFESNKGSSAGSTPTTRLAQVGDVLGSILFGNKDQISASAISGIATGNWSLSSHPSRLEFKTTSVGSTTSASRVIISEEGYVGIGVNPTKAQLEVDGSVTTNLTGGAWFSANQAGGSLGTYATGNQALSIWASNRIAATHFLAYSDKRIKKDIHTVSGKSSLDFINKVNIVDYKYKDVVSNGNQLQKGVIAQEVEAIAPDAVTTLTDFIPNVYAVSTKAIENKENNTLTVTVDKATEFKVGDLVKLISNDQEKSYEVIAISGEKEFTVKDWNEQLRDNSVFVYGKQVDDYKSVNYDYLFTENIAATQELYKMILDLQKENQELKSSIKKMDGLENELNSIKAAIQKLTPPVVGSK